MDIREYPAIDVHAHYGTYFRDRFSDLQNLMATGDAETVVARKPGELGPNGRWSRPCRA